MRHATSAAGLPALLALCLAPACGSAGSPAAPAATLQVGGNYAITPTLLQDACGSVVVAPGPAQVSHAAGADRFQLTHAGITHSGRVDTAGAFATDPLALGLASGASVNMRSEGRFSAQGFAATVTVDETRTGATSPCRYVVRWQAVKQGPANVLPG